MHYLLLNILAPTLWASICRLFSEGWESYRYSKSYKQSDFDYLYCYGRYGPLTLGPNVFKVIREYFKDIITIGLQYDPIPSMGTSWKHGIDRGYSLTVLGSPVLVDTWSNIKTVLQWFHLLIVMTSPELP